MGDVKKAVRMPGDEHVGGDHGIGIVIGTLDIGGTKVAAMVADRTGPLARMTEPTVKSGAPDALARQLVALLDRAACKAGIPAEAIDAVGVSACGPFTALDGKLALATPNICGGLAAESVLPNDWTALPLEAILAQRYRRVEIRNDCVAALLGERTFGAATGEPNCVYVTWSTGVGFGLCVDGHLLAGKHGNAGHAGHMLMAPEGRTRCGCGNLGDLESLISGVHITRGLGLSTQALFEAARNGDAAARERVMAAAAWLGRALYNLVATLDTRLFIIGGSVWQHHGDWLAPLVQQEISSRFPALTGGVTLQAPALDSVVADVGAACLVMPPSWQAEWHANAPWTRLAAMSA